MSEARTIILVGGGVGLAEGLLRAMEAQDVKIEGKVQLLVVDQCHTIKVVSRERMLADMEAVFEQVWQASIAPGRSEGKTLSIEKFMERLDPAPCIHYEGRKRAQWKDEQHRQRGRRR